MNKCRFSTWIICNLRRIYVTGFDYVYLKLFPKSVKWIKVLHNCWKLFVLYWNMYVILWSFTKIRVKKIKWGNWIKQSEFSIFFQYTLTIKWRSLLNLFFYRYIEVKTLMSNWCFSTSPRKLQCHFNSTTPKWHHYFIQNSNYSIQFRK